MSETISYLRVSTDDQSTDTQRATIESRYNIDKWFVDEATSGTIKAKDREGLSTLMNYARSGDTVIVYAIDRLGRNTVDVLETVETLEAGGVAVVSIREGFDLSTPMGKAMLTMLAAMAELERSNIKSRQMSGIERAKAEGRNLGREKLIDDDLVVRWRQDQSASIKDTAEFFGISTASVKRACRASKASQ
uniref:DNA invertase/resolvase n=1 Tax=Halomonas sp. Ant2 TaxID=1630300 RepID=A0A0D5MAU7_9GAMM|nr:recombinase family protein [Halomonas sp. Ant2]AJY53632.1 DNA invertase/resolvase [Halomonas sp. Ant2]